MPSQEPSGYCGDMGGKPFTAYRPRSETCPLSLVRTESATALILAFHAASTTDRVRSSESANKWL